MLQDGIGLLDEIDKLFAVAYEQMIAIVIQTKTDGDEIVNRQKDHIICEQRQFLFLPSQSLSLLYHFLTILH